MATNGVLDFQSTNKLIFRGTSANVVIDTQNLSLGVGHQGEGAIPYKLHVTGNANGLTTFGPVAGLGFEDSGVSFCGIKVGEKGTSPNSRTALSVEDNGNTILHVDGHNQLVGIGTTTPGNLLHVYKANNDETSGILIEKASGSIPTCAALFFGVASTTETNNRGIPKAAIFYERNLVNGRGDIKFCNDAVDDTNPVSTAASDTRMIIKNNGDVGIGTVSPDGPLHIFKSAAGAGDTGPGILFTRYSNTYGGCIWNESNGSEDGLYFNAFTNSAVSNEYGGTPDMVINSAGRVGIGTADPEARFTIRQSDGRYEASNGSGLRFIQPQGTNRWDVGCVASTDTNFAFAYNGGAKGYLSSGAGNSQLNFTGQHRTFVKDKTENFEGLIVSADQNKYIKMSGGIEAGSNAITITESLPVVSLSVTAKDKKCFGVVSTSEDPEERKEEYGNFISILEKEKGDTRVYINSVGEGAIWVTNINGPLESGDYITTSNVAGYGQKQDSEFLANYTVAKITMDCDFDPVTQPVQVIKKDEYGENILDEHDQIQWEDDPSGATEKAYKIRYLDADGNITDEANAVHTAAFVGCTYHCG